MADKIIGTSDCRDTPSREYRFFLYDPEDLGLKFYKTAEIRDQIAEHQIAQYCGDRHSDGWSEEVSLVCAGEATTFAAKANVEKRPVREDFESDEDFEDAEAEWNGGDFDETCNYELLPLTAK